MRDAEQTCTPCQKQSAVRMGGTTWDLTHASASGVCRAARDRRGPCGSSAGALNRGLELVTQANRHGNLGSR
jgi:hypothetical protein